MKMKCMVAACNATYEGPADMFKIVTETHEKITGHNNWKYLGRDE